jgi:hypothetical protein
MYDELDVMQYVDREQLHLRIEAFPYRSDCLNILLTSQ